MKTFSSLSLLGVAAVFLTEARFEIIVSVACLIGIGAILALDYGSRRPALKISSRPRRKTRAVFVPPPLPAETNRLAA
jgi:hypothetical protein